jgi:DNA-binding beta-propeller fold protein YncE
VVALAAVLAAAQPVSGAPCVAVPVADDRCEAWVTVYDHPGGHGTTGIDMPFDLLTSPDGKTVYVTGQSWQDQKDHYDFATVAYDAVTGQQRWLARYDGPGDEHDIPQNMALSKDGSRLYVVGWVHMSPVGEGSDYATVAYDTATGQQLWDATYDGSDGHDDAAYGIAVSPDGALVYVTGKSGHQHANMDFATVAYRAETGEQAWVARYSSLPDAGEDTGLSVVVAPDGRTLYMTGAAGTTWTTIAYHAGEREENEPEAGTVRWTATHQKGYAYWIALSPDGTTLYVSGSEHRTGGGGVLVQNWDYGVIAYDAATGQQRWFGFYAAPNPGFDVPFGHALSPSGDRIYLTGSSRGSGVEIETDLVTAAFDTANGNLVWSNRYENPAFAFEGGGDVAVSPSGTRVYVTGWSTAGFGAPGDMVLRAHDATNNGSVVWNARFNSGRTAQEQGFGDAIAVAPDGTRVFATGRAAYQGDPDDPLNQQAGGNSTDYVTMAYPA